MGESQFLREIEKMDSTELDAILHAAMERHRVLFPDWEIVYVSLPRNDLEMREKYLKMMMEFLEKHKK